MAISRGTLTLLRRLRITIGQEADGTTRHLTRAWARAWDELAPAWQTAIADIIALQTQTGRWPSPWAMRRLEALQRALQQSERALVRLGQETGITVADGAGRIIRLDAELEPRLIASQLPAAEQPAALARFAGRIAPNALDAIVARTTGQITSTVRPLAPAAYEQMQRALITGIAQGTNPRTTARDMLARTRGAFDSGLTRATTIARTEQLDAYRASSAYTHRVNADVLEGWQWSASLDRRTCPSCWSMHGRTFPLDTPGPQDHQQGRCARVPKTLSWRDLGIDLDEPPDAMPDARAVFASLPEADKLAIMGPARLSALQSGRLAWDDLATRRDNPGWRPSYVPVRVRDLPKEAGRRPAGRVLVTSSR